MTADVRELLNKVPFRPFTIHLADGRSFEVPTPDHARVIPGARVWVYSDASYMDVLPGLLISGITTGIDNEPAPARDN